MTRRASIVGLIVAATVATLACTFGLESDAAEGRRVVVEIRGFEFAPRAPVFRPGDVVVWVNKDIVPHTVTAEDGSWDSGRIDSGGAWTMVVTDDLSESYYCRYHPSMTGRIEVTRLPSVDRLAESGL